jgi:hypothetical protein
MADTKQLSMEDVTDKAVVAGFRADLIPLIVAMVWAESGGDAYATNVNDSDPTSASYLSMDIGLVQWNTYWNIDKPDLTARLTIPDMLDPDKALQKMAEVTAGGTKNLRLWNVYVNEKWQPFYPYSLAVAKQKGII